MAARVMFMLCSARIRRMHLAKSVYGYGIPWKILFTTASGKLGVASDDLPPNVTAAKMERSPI